MKDIFAEPPPPSPAPTHFPMHTEELDLSIAERCQLWSPWSLCYDTSLTPES